MKVDGSQTIFRGDMAPLIEESHCRMISGTMSKEPRDSRDIVAERTQSCTFNCRCVTVPVSLQPVLLCSNH